MSFVRLATATVTRRIQQRAASSYSHGEAANFPKPETTPGAPLKVPDSYCNDLLGSTYRTDFHGYHATFEPPFSAGATKGVGGFVVVGGLGATAFLFWRSMKKGGFYK